MKSSVIFEIISIVSFSLSGIMFIIAGVLFFKFNIPAVIGYLTGNTAKKKIKEMQEGVYNEKSGELIGRTDKLKTDTIKKGNNNKNRKSYSNEGTTVLSNTQETTLLGGIDETSVLVNENFTTVLNQHDTTTVIYDNRAIANGDTAGESSIYDRTADLSTAQKIVGGCAIDVAIEADIKFIHTNEVIN